MSILTINKPLGLTPLQTIERLRGQYPAFAREPITYAGRLDPMAEGVLILLTGEDRLRKDKFLQLNKIYRATMLVGVSSDTYDLLGFPQVGSPINTDQIVTAVTQLQRTHLLPFPPYSSYKVRGKPLHWRAQHQRLQEITIPLKRMSVINTWDIETKTVQGPHLQHEINRRIPLVQGNFRQVAITKQWHETLRARIEFTLASFSLEVTSGTYVRALVHELGQQQGCGALLFSLDRLAVGPFTRDNSLDL